MWLYDSSRPFTVRVRKRVGDELQVQDIPLRHEFPLRYDFMLRHSKLLPEAFDRGGQCMLRQIAALTRLSEAKIAATLDALFPDFRDKPPFNGRDWRDEGVTMRMAKAFAERHDITLRTFHGFRPVPECFVDRDNSCRRRA